MDATKPLHKSLYKATGANPVDHILLSEAHGSKQLSDHSSSNDKHGNLIDYDPSDAANTVAERLQRWYRLLLNTGSWATCIRLKTITFCWLMLADIKHHYTTATVLTVGPRDFVLLKIKVGNLNGEKGTELWTQHVTQLKNYFILSGDDLGNPQHGEYMALGHVSICWPCTKAQQTAKQDRRLSAN